MARPGDTSIVLAVLLVCAALALLATGQLAATVPLVWGALFLFGYGKWLDALDPGRRR